ncbi:MAG: phospholipase D family protein [Dehalococcoidales bacterium]|nr:phospholipase D family protein [Dehalococcoidales bacterium]
MAKFLNTSGAYAAIEDIISKASNRVVLISPYLQIPDTLLRRLKFIDANNVKIIVVCRKDDLKADVRSDLKQLKKLELRFDDHLHAKCFYNEETMVITSLNLYDYSQQNNREMGILISLKDEPDVFNEARNEAEFIVSGAEKDSIMRNVFGIVRETKAVFETVVRDETRTPGKPHIRAKQAGYCIRCGTPIPYNLDRPLCDEHFRVWAQYEDLNYPEKHCHTCGKRASTSKARPECNSCYRK